MAARLMLVEGRVQKSPEGVVHLMASHIVDRSDMIDLMWDSQRSGLALTRSLLSPADEGTTIGSDGNGRDSRHAVIPPPLHLAPPPRNSHPRQGHPRQGHPRQAHPRNARILPKSRDFH
jgi:error-prone DNA polymerase